MVSVWTPGERRFKGYGANNAFSHRDPEGGLKNSRPSCKGEGARSHTRLHF